MVSVREHSLSAELVANDVDLLTIILLRVPARSLIRLKCISKHWLSLISDAKFSQDHTLKNLKLSIPGLYSDSLPLINFKTKSPTGWKSFPKLDFISRILRRKAVILHSCNGLMLCASQGDIIVCNLTTQKFKSIFDHSFQLQVHNFIAFYPMRSSHYKVLLVHSSGIYRHNGISYFIDSHDIDIYSSCSGTWKRVHFNGPFICDPFMYDHMVLCDGSIYWFSEVNNLMRFEIDLENLITIQGPGNLDETRILWLEEYNGQLFNIQGSPSGLSEYQIFEMDKHNLNWTKRYSINLGPIIDRVPRAPRDRQNVKVLCFIGNDEEETPTIILVIWEKIVLYNLKHNYWNILQDFATEDHTEFFLSLGAHKFIESLALI